MPRDHDALLKPPDQSKHDDPVRGTFITFEGIDGCGKSTQMRMIASKLRVRGLEVVTTREPGGTSLGKRIRTVLLDPLTEVDPLTELLLFAADRAQHVRTLLRPAIAAGNIVFSDRYADATAAYQGAGRNFTSKVISDVIALATEGLKPDLTLIFDVPVAECLSRTVRRTEGENKTDRLDAEDAAFHTRVRNAYLELAAAEPNRIRIIDASGPVNETHGKVVDLIFPFLESRGRVLAAEEGQ
ncbi:MAG: dTMP kinase [Acidobacteriota bacterium]|jgi:dTMP kinase|nr:dTMP kinase [Acidobacteriota bacterium]